MINLDFSVGAGKQPTTWDRSKAANLKSLTCRPVCPPQPPNPPLLRLWYYTTYRFAAKARGWSSMHCTIALYPLDQSGHSFYQPVSWSIQIGLVWFHSWGQNSNKLYNWWYFVRWYMFDGSSYIWLSAFLTDKYLMCRGENIQTSLLPRCPILPTGFSWREKCMVVLTFLARKYIGHKQNSN